MEQMKKDWYHRWISPDSNIFNNIYDAAAALVVLIVFPMISVTIVVSSNESSLLGYGFPFFALSAAAFYDSYSRWSAEQRSLIIKQQWRYENLPTVIDLQMFSIKILVRVILHAFSVFSALFLTLNPAYHFARWIPCFFLGVSALLMVREILWLFMVSRTRTKGQNYYNIGG